MGRVELFDILNFLYRLYPVDKTRVNEFGESFEEDKKSLENKKEN